jgi:hypothetical protein
VCTCLWGGMYNPIIPVCDDVPNAWKDPFGLGPTGFELTWAYMRFFEPDVFVETVAGLAAEAGIPASDIDFNYPRILPLSSFFDQGEDRRSRAPSGLNIFDVYEHLYAREFRFVSRHGHRIAFVEAADADQPFVEAVYGRFPVSGKLAPLAETFSDTFDPVKFDASAELVQNCRGLLLRAFGFNGTWHRARL